MKSNRFLFLVFLTALFISGLSARAEIPPDQTICAAHAFKIATGDERPYSSEAKWGTASYA